MKVLFLHGLESGPRGNKADFLRQHFDVVCPALDTTRARQLPPNASPALWLASMTRPIEQAHEALREKPDVIVGSSFGGAILHTLLGTMWDGPSVLLASAATKLLGMTNLVAAPVVLVHGVRDDIIPVEHSRNLAQSAGRRLIEVDDDHRLHSILQGPEPVLLTAIRMATAS